MSGSEQLPSLQEVSLNVPDSWFVDGLTEEEVAAKVPQDIKDFLNEFKSLDVGSRSRTIKRLAR